jgi:hypothetical protein
MTRHLMASTLMATVLISPNGLAQNTSSGVGQSTGTSSQNPVGETRAAPISPANRAAAQSRGTPLMMPKETVTHQDPNNFDPRLSPGYQK